MATKIKFTEEQKAAIRSNNSMVITACPGSGKTTVIVEKIRSTFEILESYQGIIGISFTIKASKELAEKCKRNGANIKSSYIGTIDNFCLSEIVFPFINKLYGRPSSDLTCIQYSELDASYKDNLPNLSQAGVFFTTEDYRAYAGEFKRHYESGFILLEAVTVISFEIVKTSLACQRYLKARYVAIYIDEYQDTSEPQHELFLEIHALGLTAIAVGDVQQSIYAFRGSNPKYIRSLVDDSDSFEHHVIDLNHRCHPSIINYSNRLFSPHSALLPVPNNEINVYRREFKGTQKDIAERLGDWIIKCMKNLNIEELKEVAILTRNNNFLELLQTHLTIPAQFYKDDALSGIASPCARLLTELLHFAFDDKRLAEQILADANLPKLTNKALKQIRASILRLRNVPIEELADAIILTASAIVDMTDNSKETVALKDIFASPVSLQQYQERSVDKVQVMTLHKSKGLEFDLVIHLDLYDWVFPYRAFTGSFDDYDYPAWDQDLNLHYVGITRAKRYCILITSTKRINSQGLIKNATPSPFYNIEGLNGLFR